MSRIKAPKGRKRQSSTQRLDAEVMNRNRVSFDGKTLRRTEDDGRKKETLTDHNAWQFAPEGTEAFCELLDVTVQIPRGKRVAILSIVPTKTVLDAVQTIATKTATTIGTIDLSAGYPVAAVTGTALDWFESYLAGHSDTADKFCLSDIETPKATAGGTQHERETIQAGLSPAPLGKDYSQGRNQPSAALPISGQRRREDIDRPEWKDAQPITDRRCDWRNDIDK